MAKKRAATGNNRLVIVESPTKARTIERFLGDGFRVIASMGHVRDLPANAKQAGEAAKGLTYGIDVEHDYRPHYVVSPQNQSKVRALKQALAGVDEVYIATDEDREGEAIGWHVVEVLKPKVPVKRMAFHEITEAAIHRALEETRDIDANLVEAQETRRVLDRLVGYAISPLLWRKIAQGLSAGRVQSVAVRLLVERERERMDFVPAAYWDVEATVATAPHGGDAAPGPADTGPFRAALTQLDGVRLVSGKDFDDHTGRLAAGIVPGKDVVVLDERGARAVADEAAAQPWRVAAIDHREEARRPAPPFITSTLQQEASRKLGWSARDTMRVAQGLYERGLITYMRTDSTNLAAEALDAVRRTVRQRYGDDHLPDAPRIYASKSKNAQEAHEAIRPAGTDMRTAEELGLRDRDAALYDLVWKRTVASQMADARLRFTTAQLEVRADGKTATFRAGGRTTVFAGFFRAYVEGRDDPNGELDARDQALPPLEVGDAIDPRDVAAVPHETKPPARYTEASLVKRLEGEGIGRPSTYAAILDTIQQRGYVRKQGSQLVPTFTGFATTQLLEAQFAELVDEKFTAKMEDDLDEIAHGRQARVPYLDAIYAGESGIARRVTGGLASLDAKEISTIRHPRWEPYAVSVGRYGPYVEGEIDGETLRASLPDEAAVADLTRDDLERALRERNAPDASLGQHEPGGEPMFLKRGPYGHYLQLGDGTGEARPKRISLPPGVTPEDVDQAMAQALLDLPRRLGTHPESGEPVEAHIGRFGPYVRHEKLFASLPKGTDVLSVDLATALELLAKKRNRGAARRTLGDHPDDGAPVTLHDGKYGPYVKHGKVNASLSEGSDPEALTLAQALELLAARVAAKGGGRGGRSTGARGTGKSKTATKRTGAAKGGAKGRSRSAGAKPKKAAAAAKPKATPEDLIPFLDRLEADDREVVASVDGLGRTAEPVATVARRLGRSEDDVEAAAKRARFKLRMAYGKARASGGQRSG
ncbi:MAG: type I DNA topoisomerase [Trueperaceae bacterium]